MDLRQYQEDAVSKLYKVTNNLLLLGSPKTIVFEAPTGSGKTVVISELLKELVENREDDKIFSFIWTAPRQLHIQSKEKLEKIYIDNKVIRCSFFEDLIDKCIQPDEILFLNWESINKEDNIYIRENETDFNLSKIIQNTIEQERIIILIIDESHFAAKTEISSGLIQMIRPKITIEVSATPHIQGDEKITIYRENVISEGMIKKRILLNPGFKNIIQIQNIDEIKISSFAAKSTNEVILKAALDKRNELEKAFRQINSTVKPLMLIQLPDHKEGLDDIQDEIVSILKEKYHITTSNGKLAIYLSENKENLENITRNDGEADVMIFKQAIALGWDCPRACILVLFREWKSITFSIQTLGRILRMPELYHYENDELNTGFVYTNLSDVSIQEDIADSYLTINYSKRKYEYKSTNLLSSYFKRFREETRLSPQFINDFLYSAKEQKLVEKINIEVNEITTHLLSDGVITNPDKTFKHINDEQDMFNIHSADKIELKQNEQEIQIKFDLFIRNSLHPIAPEMRSIGRVKDAIYRFLKNNFLTMFEYGGVNAQMVILYPENQQKFIDVINQAKEIYLENVGKGKKEFVKNENWEVPVSLSYNNNYQELTVKHAILEPFYQANNASVPEREFIDYLESKKKEIEWWYKNGQNDPIFFAIPYFENNENKLFYVDWIIKFKNGQIGLFDTKEGITAETAKFKAEALSKYIKAENKKGKNLVGGILVHKDNSWRYNDNPEYEYNEKDLAKWKFL